MRNLGMAYVNDNLQEACVYVERNMTKSAEKVEGIRMPFVKNIDFGEVEKFFSNFSMAC